MSHDDDGSFDDTEDMDELELGDDDAALVFRADGTISHVLPVIEDDDDGPRIEEGSPSMTVAVILYLLSDPNRFRALTEEFVAMADASSSGKKAPERILH